VCPRGPSVNGPPITQTSSSEPGHEDVISGPDGDHLVFHASLPFDTCVDIITTAAKAHNPRSSNGLRTVGDTRGATTRPLEQAMCPLGIEAADTGTQDRLVPVLPVPTWDSLVRRTLDFFLAALGLVVLAIPMLVIVLVIRLTNSGPALFEQRRVGLGGRTFTMYKFRTMRIGVGDELLRQMIAAELRGEDTSVDGSYKLDSDPRVTPVGAFLRKTSLDELPQLLNVLLGDMSLVGPRPCLDWEAQMFPAQFRQRFAVRPGLTGLWQVSGRSTVSTLEMLHLDLTYVRTRNLRGDLSILVRTVPSMLRDSGAR
jgi:lipopolysaccharide/colanic/teichoic acid biosynthesis glycosyltransferase